MLFMKKKKLKLNLKRYLFSPGVMREYGIVPDTVVQYPGEFVVTFPFSYHAGFNHGVKFC
jgi:[histone H3]-trimethyl-L-lysine9/36 demethylase